MTIQLSNPQMRSLTMVLAEASLDEMVSGATPAPSLGDPEFGYLVHLQRSRMLAMLKREDESIAALEQAVAMAPDRPELRCSLAARLQARGDSDGALAVLARCAAEQPQHVEAWLRRAELQLARGDLAAAERGLRAGLAHHVGEPELLSALTDVLLRGGDREGALETLIERVWNHSGDRQTLARLLVLAQNLGDEETEGTAQALARRQSLDQASLDAAREWLAALG